MCKHDWKLLSETITESKFEHTIRIIKSINNGEREMQLPWQLVDADRKHIQTFTCSKCGKLKRFVEDI